jgi:DNA processing protein
MQLLSRQQRVDWIRLSQCENVGPQTFRQLVARYGGASKALEALPELSRQGGLRRPLKLFSAEAAEAILARVEEIGAHFVVAGETGYPALLHHIHGAPPILCVMGRLELGELDCVAIVGARNASAGGMRLARQLAAELSEEGFLVTSGLARGIDRAAHEASPDGRTAAVVAGGIDVVYPPEHHELQHLIGRNGLLVSEMLPGTVPLAKHFPRRNRIISGMARAVIVVEAALRSGSLITARNAAEQGRDVYAVPGSPLDPRAEGTNKLIRDGATIVTSTHDVIDALKAEAEKLWMDFTEPSEDAAQEPGPAPADRDRVLSLLSPTPTDVDDIIRESGCAPAAIAAILLELELAGRVNRSARQKVSLA